MENATKALLIAGGVFFGLIILTVLIFAYTQVINYYRSREEITKTEQVIKFNSQYDAYIRNDVRGNEILSLMNRILDYNKREADVEGIKFERMIIEVNLAGMQSEFKYPIKDNYKVDNKNIITNIITNSSSDNEISKISNAVQTIRNNTGVNYSESQLQRLATEISNIFAPDDFPNSDKSTPSYISSCSKRNTVVQNIIGVKYDDLSDSDKSKLREATLEYYQYQRFKRAHFDCETTKTVYNQGTGRIVKLVFKFNGKFE